MEATASNEAIEVDNRWQRRLDPALAGARDKIEGVLDEGDDASEVDDNHRTVGRQTFETERKALTARLAKIERLLAADERDTRWTARDDP
jgi:hypothetical protein